MMVNVEKQRAIVENLNLVSKHTKPNADNPKGGIIKKEAPIHISNLKLIDSNGSPAGLDAKRMRSQENQSVIQKLQGR